MVYIGYFISKTLALAISVIQILMFVRVILSWIPSISMGGGKLVKFIFTMTEIVVYPVRRLFDHYSLFQNSPLDIPFMTTWFLLMAIDMFLPSLI